LGNKTKIWDWNYWWATCLENQSVFLKSLHL
jgi:hypothetical protein